MSFNRTALPATEGYYESQGLKFQQRRGKWRSTACVFHGGSDSMRINLQTGAFVCMTGCGAHGGDVLAYHMALHGLNFTAAAKDLGAWVEDDKPAPARPNPFPARDALAVLSAESNLVAVTAANMAHGVVLSQMDLSRLLQAADRIQKVTEVFA